MDLQVDRIMTIPTGNDDPNFRDPKNPEIEGDTLYIASLKMIISPLLERSHCYQGQCAGTAGQHHHHVTDELSVPTGITASGADEAITRSMPDIFGDESTLWANSSSNGQRVRAYHR